MVATVVGAAMAAHASPVYVEVDGAPLIPRADESEAVAAADEHFPFVPDELERGRLVQTVHDHGKGAVPVVSENNGCAVQRRSAREHVVKGGEIELVDVGGEVVAGLPQEVPVGVVEQRGSRIAVPSRGACRTRPSSRQGNSGE